MQLSNGILKLIGHPLAVVNQSKCGNNSTDEKVLVVFPPVSRDNTTDSHAESVLTYVNIFLQVTCFFALSFAVYCLHKRKRNRLNLQNQKYILTNLCIIELLTVVCFLKIQIYEVTGTVNKPAEAWCEYFVRFALAAGYPLTMHHIAVDRFLEIYLHLKYPILICKRVTLKVIGMTWLISIAFSIILLFFAFWHSSAEAVSMVCMYFVFTMDLSVLVCAIFVYSYLYTKYKALSTLHSRCTSLKKTYKSGKFRIPLLIVVTYVVFEVTASLFTLARHLSHDDSFGALGRKISLTLYAFGFLTDAGIYIFFQTFSRRTISKMRCCCCCSGNRVADVSMIERSRTNQDSHYTSSNMN